MSSFSDANISVHLSYKDGTVSKSLDFEAGTMEAAIKKFQNVLDDTVSALERLQD
ncbi:hypothetical protein AXJ10_gp45 [Gordonia phage GordTnk2]|uniref:Uncharacterized protein n=1 Tax=Gordonia phage GordTnk2 TaxID=1622192 RepID=A0A0E3T7T6_9CAUD|nr:hypothetical protein AXJ10_gp45 [Gordonia phage GordTnk2]AKC02785.1 hypothetical protein GordTnk2_45 [Gordonia phage GordTnk2]